MTDKEVLALKIMDWDEKYEVNAHGRIYQFGETKRKKSLPWIRHEGVGLGRTEEHVEIMVVAGPERTCRAKGLYYDLLLMAGGKKREHRGWILNRRLEPLGVPEIAAILGYPVEHVAEDIELLRLGKFLEWHICPFAVDCGKPVRFGVSPDETRIKENLPKFAKKRDAYKPDPDKLSLDNPDIRAGARPTENGGEEAADTPASGGPVGGSLGGLPAPRPEDLESGDLESGGSSEVGEAFEGGRADGTGDLGSGNLTGAGGGQGGKAPLSETPGEALKMTFNEGGKIYPVSWQSMLFQLDEKDRLAKEDAAILTLGLDQYDNDVYRREVAINRGWKWIKKLFPEQLDPGPQSPKKVQDEAKGSDTTFIRRLTSLWDIGGQNAIVEAVRLAQDKHREMARGRSHIRDPVAVVMGEINRRIKAGQVRKNNKSPPE